jgi:diguanylate cyclase (GGDEF)-like protein
VMAQQQNYRKPRNKELRDLTWSLPYPLRITDPKGKILWQNQAAESIQVDSEWSETPTTWQNKKALLQTPAQMNVASDVMGLVDDLETVVERLKRQQKDTARKKRQAESKLKSGERELDSLRKKLVRLEERQADLERENKTLADQGSPPDARQAKELERLKERVSELESHLQQADEKVAEQKSQLEDASEVDTLNVRVSELEAELQNVEELHNSKVSELETKLQEVEAAPSGSTDELDALKAKFAQLQDDKKAVENWVEELEQSRENHDQELEKAHQELTDLKTEYQDYKRQVEDADAERQLQEQLAEKIGEFERLEQQLEEEQKAFDLQKKELEERLVSQETELGELKDGFESQTTPDIDVEKLQTELADAQRGARRLEEKLEGLEELKAERDSLLESVQGDLKESHQREKELRETLKLYSDIRKEAEKARDDAKTFRARVEELEDSQQKLKQDLIAAKEKLISGGSSSGEGMSLPVKSQIDFLTKRLKDTEQKLDQSVAHLKEEKARNQSSKESERLAFQDTLTGLPNMNMVRRYLSYARQQAASSGRAIGLFLINLDGFRVLNTTYGREWGDELLKVVGERLNGMRGGSHIVARHSQDRFMLLAADLERSQLNSFVEQASRSLLEAISYPFDVQGEQVKVTCTIGIALGPAQGDHPDQLYQCAEMALEVAQRSGPGRYAMFDDRLRQSLKQESTYKSQMAFAIDKDEFKAVYQPVYSLTKKCVLGLELLTRWQHRDQTLLKPSAFLEPAIKSGLIMKITERLWPKAFANFARWQRMRKGLTLSINLCDKELLSPSLLEKTVNWVQQAGVDPGSVLFEVRDGSAVRMSPAWWEVLQRYSQAGFGLCLDDYGSDASLFGTLAFHGFRQAKVRIDEGAISLTPAVQGRRDLEFCAKGVQTKFDKKALSKAGFHLAQGYAVSRPIDAEGVDGFLG